MATTFFDRRGFSRFTAALTALIVGAAVLPLTPGTGVVSAAAAVPVRYDAFNNIVYIGDNYNPADPAQAPYVGYPSGPGAPKLAITLPEVAAELTSQGLPNLLTNQGNVWTLTADTVISQTARLDVTSATANELRLDSSTGFPAGVSVIAEGGHLNIDGVHVLSWANGAPDTNLYDGRSWLLAENGGRMDILNAEITHLGWDAGRESGLSWRKRGINVPEDQPTDDPNIIRTGSTGSIINSNIHSNLFGQYSYEAYGLVARNNEFHDNIQYGFDPHDYSTGFIVENNKVYNNGKHGIIFSRGCTLNIIRNNEVWGNAEHGIMMDRGSNTNQITGNLVYNNSDGIAIFQSEKNLIQNNTLRGNERGVRINATFDTGDRFDGLSNENVVLNNTIADSTQYGIYLYERADKNKIEGNTVQGSAASALYIKTGGNTIKNNIIRTNDNGITILGGEPITPGGAVPSYDGGHKNTIIGNTIADNNGSGIQLKGAVDTAIGLVGNTAKPTDANTIQTNGTHGISLDTSIFGGVTYGSAKNVIIGNTIQGNLADGVIVNGAESIKNLISRNSISVNSRAGINLKNGANDNIFSPKITSTAEETTITGSLRDPITNKVVTKYVGATIEVYRDTSGQGAVYKGSTTVNAQGNWSFALPAGDNPAEGAVTAIAIDQYNNTSAFSASSIGGNTTYAVLPGANGETTVFIRGPGSNVTLPDIQRALKTISPTVDLIEQVGNPSDKVWMSNVSLFVDRGVTLTLTTDTVSELRLRSQGSEIQMGRAAGNATYNYKSFTALRTYNGVINIDGITITSFDPASGGPDTDISNGRSYVLAKYDAKLNINNAKLRYLGSADGESYGIAWRDINSSEQPGQLLTRVTGTVQNSEFSNNYYGIYTFQARDMVFRGNKFHNNIGYGFDPHDFSTGFLVENNESFENGNHGFIISRGCNNFTIRNNKSYNNRYQVGEDDRKAHGFMLDPGSPNSRFQQEPSFNNLLEGNEAWGNDGYGLRVVGSITNTIQMNIFRDNLTGNGITLEQGSTGNRIIKNTISGNGLYGIYLFGGSDKSLIQGNTVTKNGKHGLYVKTGSNTITENTITENGAVVDGLPVGAGIATLRESDIAAATLDLTLPGTHTSLAADAPELVGKDAQASEVANNVISKNRLLNNVDDGIELKSATDTTVEGNTIQNNGTHGVYLTSGTVGTMVKKNVISGNGGYGIRANGTDTFNNVWSENPVYGNALGGIITTSQANNNIKPPTMMMDGQTATFQTMPGGKLEIYSDDAGQGKSYETSVMADANGTVKIKRNWKGAFVNAFVTFEGNSSGFMRNIALSSDAPKIFIPMVGVKR